MVVRGTLKDREEIYRILSQEMHPEIGNGKISPEKALDRIDLCLRDGIVFISWEGGEVSGTVGLFQAQFWYTDEDHWTDAWFFIRKPFRTGRTLMSLMKAVRTIPNTYLGIGSAVEIERKERLFSRFGEKVGALYRVS